jgi:hypothetical protein
MNRKLDLALTKSLRELLGTSGKRIAVYFKEGVHEPQILSVYQNETPPPKHPLRPDFSFAGFVNLETGDVEMWKGESQTRRSITWTMVGRAVIGLLWLCLKMAFWCIIGIVLIVGMFAGVGTTHGISRTISHRK